MAEDLATLSIALDNAQAIAGAKQAGAAFETMGLQGTAAARNIAASLGPVEQAILRQNTQLQQTANITAASTRSMGTFSAIEAEAAGHVGEHSLSLSRLERSLGSLTEHVLGLNPQMTLLAETFGRFALGSIEMVGILGAIAALSYAWQKLTADADAAEKKHTEFLKNVGDMANSAEAAKINTAAHTLLYGTPFDEKGNLVANSTLVAGAFKGSLADMEAEYAQIMAKIPKDATMVAGAIAEQLHDLVPKLDAARKEFHELQDAGNNLANQPSGVPGQMDPVKAHAESNAQILADDKKLADAGKALDDAGAASLQHSLNLVREYNQHTRDGMLADDKRAAEESARASEEAWKRDEEAMQRALDRERQEQQKFTDEMAHEFARVFDDILLKGQTSFRQLFDDIKAMYIRMLTEMEAKNLAQSFVGMLGGSGGDLSNAGVVAASLQALAPGAVVGAGVGNFVGSSTGSRAAGVLSGAASGAVTGAEIAGPIGAIVGGAAGLVGGLLGAESAAKKAAEALKELQLKETQVGATLADWRAQITGTAADQKAAALLDIKMKYLSIQADIERLEAGKKMEAQRNADLATAAADYALALKNSANSVTGAFSSLVNAVQGYRYQVAIFGASTPVMVGAGGGGTGGGGSGSTGGGSGRGGITTDSMNVTLVLADGTSLGKAVLKSFKSTAQQRFGASKRWGEL